MLATLYFFHNDDGYYTIANFLDSYKNPAFSLVFLLATCTYNL